LATSKDPRVIVTPIYSFCSDIDTSAKPQVWFMKFTAI